jgi:hypothetical protein
VAVLALLLVAGCSAQEPPKPANAVIVMIDRSLSFQARQQNAIDSTLRYLDQIASRKLGRWEGKNDKVVLISMDAMPAVLWRGNLQELKAMSRADWSEQFAARSDYQRCTDVASAFSLAGEEFAAMETGPTYKYLLVFSDLVHEPPTQSATVCAKAQRGPADDFPWAVLKDVSVNVFWLPVNQKLIWQRALREQGLSGQVTLYTDSESGTVQIAPPPQAKVKVTASERAAAADRFKTFFGRGLWLLAGLGATVVLTMAAAIVSARRRGRAPQAYARPQILTPAQLRARNARPGRHN